MANTGTPEKPDPKPQPSKADYSKGWMKPGRTGHQRYKEPIIWLRDQILTTSLLSDEDRHHVLMVMAEYRGTKQFAFPQAVALQAGIFAYAMSVSLMGRFMAGAVKPEESDRLAAQQRAWAATSLKSLRLAGLKRETAKKRGDKQKADMFASPRMRDQDDGAPLANTA